MTLKQQLEIVSPEGIDSIFNGYVEKTDSLNETGGLDEETITLIQRYPALSHIVEVISYWAIGHEPTIEEAVKVSVGASIAIGLLIEVAEVLDLPPMA